MSISDLLIKALGETPPPVQVLTDVPELRGKLFAQTWTVPEATGWGASVAEIEDNTEINARLIADRIVDKDGNKILTVAQAMTCEKNNGKLWAALLNAAQEAIGTKLDEDLEKNLPEKADDTTDT